VSDALHYRPAPRDAFGYVRLCWGSCIPWREDGPCEPRGHRAERGPIEMVCDAHAPAGKKKNGGRKR